VRWVGLACRALAATALFGVMALTFADVVGRKLLGSSIFGSLEMTEILLVAVVFSGLPLVSLERGHVVFDSLDGVLPAAVARVQHRVVEAASALILGGAALLTLDKGVELRSYGDTTPQLGLPLWPFVFAIAALLLATALVHLARASGRERA